MNKADLVIGIQWGSEQLLANLEQLQGTVKDGGLG